MYFIGSAQGSAPSWLAWERGSGEGQGLTSVRVRDGMWYVGGGRGGGSGEQMLVQKD